MLLPVYIMDWRGILKVTRIIALEGFDNFWGFFLVGLGMDFSIILRRSGLILQNL